MTSHEDMWMILAAVMANERIVDINQEEECNRALFAMLKDTALPFRTRFNVLRILGGLLDRVTLLERLLAEDSTDGEEEDEHTDGEEETHQEREERWAQEEEQFNEEQEETINIIDEGAEEDRELEELRKELRRTHGSADLHSANT